MNVESDGKVRSPAKQISRLIHLLAEDQRRAKKQFKSAVRVSSPRAEVLRAEVRLRADILTQISILRRDPGRPLLPRETPKRHGPHGGLRVPAVGEHDMNGTKSPATNPVSVILDLLRGAGWADEEIDIVSFRAAETFVDGSPGGGA